MVFPDPENLTSSLFSPKYSSPSQAQVHMLSGRLPYSGPSSVPQKIDKIYTKLTELDPSLPPAIDAVIDRALEPNANKRFHTAAEFINALERVPFGK